MGCNLAVVHQVAAEAGKLDTAVAGLGADIQDRVAVDRMAVVDDDIGCNLVVVLMDWKMDYNPVVVPLVLDFDKDYIVRAVVLDSMLMVVPELVGADDVVPVLVLHQMVLVYGQVERAVRPYMVPAPVVEDRRVVGSGVPCMVLVRTLVAAVVEDVEVDLSVVALVDEMQVD